MLSKIDEINNQLAIIQDQINTELEKINIGDDSDAINEKIKELETANIQLQKDIDELLSNSKFDEIEKLKQEKNALVENIETMNRTKITKEKEIEDAKNLRIDELSNREDNLEFEDYKSNQEVKVMNENITKA